MIATRYTQAYQRTAVESADPRHLVVMLYDAAVRFLTQAQEAMSQREYERQCESITKAQAILSELSCALDLDAGAIATQLRDFYTYIYNRLVEANLRDDLELLRDVTAQVTKMRHAWAQAEMQAADAQTLGREQEIYR